MNAIELNDIPHVDARRLASSGAPVYVFVNPVEYHGPHLSLHNDAFIAKGLARDLHARMGNQGPLVVGADLEMGVDPCQGPGSKAFPFEAVRDACIDVAHSLCDLGASRVVWMTFHGSPLHEHAIEAGVEVVRKRGGRSLNPMNCLMDLLVNVDGRRFRPAVDHVADEAEKLKILDAIPDDFHGGFFETSLTLHYAPESCSLATAAALPPCPPLTRDKLLARLERAARAAGKGRLADELDLAARAQGWGALRPFPGYTGAPHRASAGAGAYFADQILGLYGDPVRAALDQGRPAAPPVMPWVLWATLGGRVDAARKLDLAHLQA